MKKVICIILVLVTMAGCSLAAGVDVTALTDEEFVELYTRMNQELVNRKIEKTAHLKAGMYIGGKDIPVGEYLLVVGDGTNEKPIYFSFTIFGSLDSFGGSIDEKSSYQRVINVVEDSRLQVQSDFDLVIRPRGVITFE